MKEMAAKGRNVPSLGAKPEVPSYLQIVLTAHSDLTAEGYIKFSEYCLWCDRFGIRGVQFEYLWDVLKAAHNQVYEWKAQNDKSSQQKSARTTGRT